MLKKFWIYGSLKVNKLRKLKPGWGIVPVAIFLAIWEIVAG
jgi:hypothetical protein